MRKGTKIILGVAAGTAAVFGVSLLIDYLQQRELYGGYLDDDYEDEDDYEYDEDDYDYEEDLEDECCCVAKAVKEQQSEVKAVEDSKEGSTSEEIPVEEVMQ